MSVNFEFRDFTSAVTVKLLDSETDLPKPVIDFNIRFFVLQPHREIGYIENGFYDLYFEYGNMKILHEKSISIWIDFDASYIKKSYKIEWLNSNL
jgi:hypothetical protein